MSNITPAKYRRRVIQPHSDEIRTEQQWKDECDINHILKRYQKTGLLNHINKAAPMYGDFTMCDDLRGALDKVNIASEIFESVPAHIRAQFENDPINYMEYMINPANRDSIEELGLPTAHLGPRPATQASPAPQGAATPANAPESLV